MDNDDGEIDVSDEAAKFLSQPITRLEVIQLVQPLRGLVIPIFHAAMTSLVVIMNESEDKESREKAMKSFDELREIFGYLEKFDDRVDMMLSGKKTWDGELSDE